MKDYRQNLAASLSVHTALSTEETYALIEVPPQPELGDYAFPCFRLAKTLRQAPARIAARLAAELSDMAEKIDYLADIRAAGPYLNFFLDRQVVASETVASILQTKQAPGVSDLGQGRTVLVEYSSPNIAKPFHIGHAFTTILGESLKRIYNHLGYHALGLNHLGDYGTQFGKLIVAYERWGDETALEKNPIQELLRIYVKFHGEAQKDPALETEARKRFRSLEAGEKKEEALWKRFRDLSLREFERVYRRMDVHFDSYIGESFYSSRIPAVADWLKKKGLLEESEGAQVVRLDDEGMPPCIILKSDGATIYASRDIAAVLYREQTWHFYKNIYVVGLPQSLHFCQVFSVLKKAGCQAAEGCVHVGFGTVKLPEGTMSTRKGQVILLEDLLNEAVDKTAGIIRANALERGEEMSEAEIVGVAEKVGIGAVQYAFLRNGRERDIVFDWDEMLDFNGDTAPYLQYTYARARSILRRAGVGDAILRETEASALGGEQEFMVVQALRDFPDAVIQAAEHDEPSILARQLQQIARAFNKFYGACTILNDADEKRKMARLALCAALCRVLATGLNLLGIQTVERM